jgi:hypothetical protein
MRLFSFVGDLKTAAGTRAPSGWYREWKGLSEPMQLATFRSSLQGALERDGRYSAAILQCLVS